MPKDPIPNQIDRIGNRRLAGCTAKFAALLLVGIGVLAVTTRTTRDPGTRFAVAVGLCGLLFGFYVSLLSTWASRVLSWFFVLFPIAATLVMYVCRTMLGWSDELPLRLVLAPLAFAAGFLVGKGRLARVQRLR